VSQGFPRGVALVIPCRDASPWLSELFESIDAQTRAPDQIVVVDDGSRDDSVAVARSWTPRSPDLSLTIVEQDRLGLATAVNRGVDLTTAPMVARVDADDVLAPGFLEQLEAALLAAPSDVGYAYPAVQMFGDVAGRYPTREFDAAHLVIAGNFACAAALMRREAFLAAGGVSDLPAWEDWDLWLKFLSVGFRGVLVDEELYRWRRHGTSRNTLSLVGRRALRIRIYWRHRSLVRRHLRLGWRAGLYRVRHSVRQQ
jgi:glycosyltransferase involved in cell wall biosynthesis